MEALAAASGVAGLASLAGQLLTAAIELRGFFSDVSKAPKNIESFLHELNNLIKILEGTSDLCDRIEKYSIKGQQPGLSAASLKIQLDDCQKDVNSWIAVARDYYIGGEKKGGRMKVKKFWAAVNKDVVSEIRIQIQTHCHFISTTLEVLGREIDLKNSETLNRVTDSLDYMSELVESGPCGSSGQESLQLISSSVRSMCSSSEELRAMSTSSSQILLALEERSQSADERLERIEGLLRDQSPSPHHSSYKIDLLTQKSGSAASTQPGILWNHRQDQLSLKDSVNQELSSSEYLSQRRVECCIACFRDICREESGRTLPCQHPIHTTCLVNRASNDGTKDKCPVCLNEDAGDSDGLSDMFGEEHDMASRFEHWAESFTWEPKPSSTFFTDCVAQKLPLVEGIKKWTDTLYPPSMSEYITNVYLSRFVTQQLRFIEQAAGIENGQPIHEDSQISQADSALPLGHDRTSLILVAEHLKEDLLLIQNRTLELKQICLSDGFRVYEIEQLFRVDETRNFLSQIEQIRTTAKLDPYPSEISHSYATRKIRRNAMDTSALKDWTSNHDRINGWLLHVLQASKEAAQLHRSFLSDPHIDDDSWARLVLKYWSLDGAAPRYERTSNDRRASTAVDSQASRSVISAASAGIFLDPEFQRELDSGWKGVKATPGNRKKAIYDQLQDRYRCQHCDLVVAETDKYISHLAQHCHTMPFLCNLRGCTKRFMLEYELTAHTTFHKALLAHRKLPPPIDDQPTPALLASYITSVQRLKEIQGMMHKSSRRSIEAEYNRISAERADAEKGDAWMLVRDLRTKEIAAKAIELLNLEKVENLWRKACALRWRCCHEGVLSVEWMTEREVEECRFVSEFRRGPIEKPGVVEVQERHGEQRRRRHSL